MIFPRPWKYTLEISDIWKKRRAKEITIQELCKEIFARGQILKNQMKEYDPELEDLLDEILLISENTESDEQELIEEFDSVWDSFYDWADHTRVWVNIF